MSTEPIVAWVLRNQRRSLAVWAFALVAVSTFYISIYPVMGADEMLAATESLPEAMVEALGYENIGKASGYVDSTVFGLLGPLLLLVFGIGLGARLVAGDEERGFLELELTGPTSRTTIYLQRLAALWLNLAALIVAVLIAVAVLNVVLDLEIGLGRLVTAGIGMGLMVGLFATVALAVGAATGRRAQALGAAAAIAVVGFMLDAIGPAIDADWMNALSPFSWFGERGPLTGGVPMVGLVAPVVVAGVVAALGLVRFDRRDLMV